MFSVGRRQLGRVRSSSEVRNSISAHIALGTLTDTPGVRPTANFFVASKSDGFEIIDDLPEHEEFG